MGFDDIRYIAFLLYKKCNIKQFPFDCNEMLDKLGIEYVKYSNLSIKKQEACLAASDSAFLLDFKIYYNDRESSKRIRFSLMHELGHIVLGHKEHTEQNEKEANFFAKNILAPPMAIHYCKEKNARDISSIFNITPTFAKNSIVYYNKWLNVTKGFGMSSLDKEFYQYFYSNTAKRFVVNERGCIYCMDAIYNVNEPICKNCEGEFINQMIEEHNESIRKEMYIYGP